MPTGKIVNKKEFRVVGLQRSGNHAIINWILSQCLGKGLFLNFVKPNANPYATAVQNQLGKFTKHFDLKRERIILSYKDYLLYSYEDDYLEKVFSDQFEAQHDRYVGISKRRFDILILRDPYNLFASRIKMSLDKPGGYPGKISLSTPQNMGRLKSLWKSYALEYLNKTHYLRYDKLCINYNRWFSDKSYRQKIAKRLFLRFTDRGIDEYAVFSSFENTVDRKSGAQNLKIYDRWKIYIQHPWYRKYVLEDEELKNISDKIFGRII